MSMASRMTSPNAKMSNYNMPRPSGSVMGPPRLKMPEKAGDKMPRASAGLDHSALGFPTSPLPEHPLGPYKGGMHHSLFSTDSRGPSGLAGVRKM